MSLDSTVDTTEVTKEETKVEEPETPKQQTEEKTEETSEEDEDEEPEEEEQVEDDLTDKDKENATALYRALKNPETAKTIITELAKQAGLLGQTGNKAARTIVEIVQEQLGDEYSFLAPKIAPAIKAVVQEELKIINERYEQDKLRQAEDEVNQALADIHRITKGDIKKYENKIAQLLDEMPPSGKVPIKKHLMRLYTIAKQDESRQLAKTERLKKASENANDLGTRLSVAGLSGKAKAVVGKVSLDQAVEEAFRKLERQG